MKRHAIDCKKIGESKTSPGFYKFEIKIQEKDGSISHQPAYGRDMQEAISRLVWNERVVNITTKKPFTIGMIIAWIMTIIIPSFISSRTDSPIWILSSIGFSILIGFLIIILERYFYKANKF
jgi:hypothetical protein